jgi:NAD(P)-dependent dehydrogenase (short-subunit alcohol dehydrogenase family)
MASEQKLDGKVAVITGASRGIGKQIALDFAAHGARVVMAARGQERLDSTVAEVTDAGGTALGVQADVGALADCKKLIDAAVAAFGTVDVLVNSAAISGPSKLLRDVEPEEWQEVIDVNLTGTWACIHYALTPMMAQESGSIVNIGSFNGKYPMVKRSPYAASKLGVVGITRGLALELGPYNIRVNTVSPGPTEGERCDEVIAMMAGSSDLSEDQVREQLLSMSPLHRMADNFDVARMALYLASEDGRAMTGQDINMTAGLVTY